MRLDPIPAGDRWGPFALDLDPAERTARLRCLRAVVHLTCGERAEALLAELRRAETSRVALVYALAALNDLEALDRRHVWASYAAINRPA